MDAKKIITTLDSLSNKKLADTAQRFFKTDPGQYAHGDIFIGIRMADIRKTARLATSLQFDELIPILASPIHEHRLCAVIVLANRAKVANPDYVKVLHDFYLTHKQHINNWDIVDASAHYVVGRYVHTLPATKRFDALLPLLRSGRMWDKRIAMVSQWWLIRQNSLTTPLKVAKCLLGEPNDLMHKAVGWMLREAWKQNPKRIELFLQRHYDQLSRTTLRYAIERFEETKRKKYLAKVFT